MKITLPKPEVIGELPAGTLDSYPDDTAVRSIALEGEDHPVVHDVAEQLSNLALRHGRPIRTQGYESRFLESGQSSRASHWHTDGANLLIANTEPTEFLIGRFNLTRSLRKAWRIKQRPSDTFFYEFLSEAVFHKMSDEQLKDLGLEVWRPEPNQIVYKDDTYIHRGIQNRTTGTLKRVLMFATFTSRRP